MVQRPAFLVTRDKLKPHLGRLADMLDNPDNLIRVQAEMRRLAAG